MNTLIIIFNFVKSDLNAKILYLFPNFILNNVFQL